MARLLPTDISELSLSLGLTAELRTLQALRDGLPSSYTVYHSVHWTRDAAYRTAFGEADFIITNLTGNAIVVEMKSGVLDETKNGLIKRYSDGRKNVVLQIHRTLDGLRDQFKRQSGRELVLDYLIYCPDYRVHDLNAAGLNASRIVDARDAPKLCARITAILPAGITTDHGKRVQRFFENCFHLVPDIHAHVEAAEKAMVRLSGGLADTLSAIEMTPLKLRVSGTAGCGKSVLAARFAGTATAAQKRVLLVCFNRPLAECIRSTLPTSVYVETFYGLMDQFLTSRGHRLDYSKMREPNFWKGIQERVISEIFTDEWKFDALIVDEGQDFEPEWSEILDLFLKSDADHLWLEDPDQAIRWAPERLTSSGATRSLERGFVGFRARANYRSPESIARYIQRVLPFDFLPSNPLPGLGVGVATYKGPNEQKKRVGAIVTDLVRTGFQHSDIIVLSMYGLEKATFAKEDGVGPFTLSRPTGEYNATGAQLFEVGQVRFDTIYRFKGQQSPAVILTDIDPDPQRLRLFERLLFTAMTRATVRLDLVIKEGNAASEFLVQSV